MEYVVVLLEKSCGTTAMRETSGSSNARADDHMSMELYIDVIIDIILHCCATRL